MRGIALVGLVAALWGGQVHAESTCTTNRVGTYTYVNCDYGRLTGTIYTIGDYAYLDWSTGEHCSAWLNTEYVTWSCG